MTKEDLDKKIGDPIENAKFLLDYIKDHLTDVKFDGPDTILVVDGGNKIFLLSGIFLKEVKNGKEEK